MAKKIIINSLKKSIIPFRNTNSIRTNPLTKLRPIARIRPKYLKNIPDSTPENGNYLSKQIIKSYKNGDYTEEVLYPSFLKQINHYNSQDKRLNSTDIRLSAGRKQTIKRTYNNAGKVTHIETENLSVTTGKKHIQKCDINPATNKITKYEAFDSNNKPFAIFERDDDEFITHFIDNKGNEFNCDTETFTSTMTYKDTGKTEKVSYFNTAGKFYSYIRPQIHIDMKKYL